MQGGIAGDSLRGRNKLQVADLLLAFNGAVRYQSRMNKESIDSLARRLAASLPQGLRAMREDMEENFRAVLKSSLARMDLVTREEFEVQEAVLARTREKLETIELRLAAFEQAATPAASRKKARKKASSKVSKKSSAGKSANDKGNDSTE